MGKVKNFFVALGKWFNLKDRPKRILIIALCLVLAGGLLGSMVQTDFYRYRVYSETIETVPVSSKGEALYEETGVKSWSTADIYQPKSASAEDPVPLVFVVPGIQRTKETQASFCIELVRRGYAVICIDPYGQGESSSSYEAQSATQEGYGLFSWMDYLFENPDGKFDWVDFDRVGACGHSAGGNACQKLAEREGRMAAENKTVSRVHGVYITGYIRGLTWSNTACNVGISYSQNDEGAFQNSTAQKKEEILAKDPADRTEEEEWWLTVGNADLRYAQESIDLVNYQLKRGGSEPIDEVEIGFQYGNPYQYNYVIVNNETALHALQPYDSATIAHLVEFFDYTFDSESGLSSSNQLWWLKEAGGALSLVGGFMFICALFVLLLRTRAFQSIGKGMPPRNADQKVKGRIIFWISFVVSAVIACVLYMVCVRLSVEWFPEAAGSSQTWFFPQRFTNAVMLWAVFNGLIGIAIFFLTWGLKYAIDYFAAKKKGAAEGETLPVADVHASYRSILNPLKLGWKDALKTVGMAAILICAFFALDYLIYGIFHTDMRVLFISARVSFSWRAILAIAMYIPFFFLFYFSNSLRANCSMRPANWKEWLSKLIAMLSNTVGLIAIVFIQYIPMIASGQIGYTGTVGPEWLFVNLLFSIIPMMAALPLFNRFFFNRTGSVWLGPIVTCVIFIVMTGGATTIYFAL